MNISSLDRTLLTQIMQITKPLKQGKTKIYKNVLIVFSGVLESLWLLAIYPQLFR